MDLWMFLAGVFTTLVVLLMGDTWGKGLNAASTTADVLHTRQHRCGCTIHVDNSTRGHYDLGTIKTIKLRHTYPSVATTCHSIRHRCHKACAKAADLKSKVDSKESLGYQLCMRHEQVTHGSGAKVLARGRIDTPECQRHQHMKAAVGKQRLCCGHSVITVKDNKFLRAYGWNPDCKGVEYVLGYK